MIVEKAFGGTTVGNTLIINCTHCGGLLLAAEDQRTRTCPYCGLRIELRRANRVMSAKNAFDASEMLQELKKKRQSNPRVPDRR